ncbi:MAG: matrixin family metalloprotease [Candidatus Melainabacteria bacterium]|nr:matrixin family metalloprotease [Candidatus Melainabacteria bacterium]
MSKTYLDRCLKDDRILRWPNQAFPLAVFVAPFRWYEKSKQQQSYQYNKLITDALDTWTQLSGGLVSFRQVPSVHDSQIDIKWRRVDRKSLGHCEYSYTKEGVIYSAEIQIGISDGILHARYNDIDEVKHTILHEIGHALGIVGHSNGPEDIMYVPHQYGVVNLSERDIETLRWLYRFPVGSNPLMAGQEFNLKPPFTVHDVIAHMSGDTQPNQYQHPLAETTRPSKQPQVLASHHDILTQQGKFHLMTQNIQVDPSKKHSLLNARFRKQPPAPPPLS